MGLVGPLVHHAVAVLADNEAGFLVDAAVAVVAHIDQLEAGGVKVLGSHRGGHLNAVAHVGHGHAGIGVGGQEVVVLGQHLLVVGIAAGGQNHGRSVDRDSAAVGLLSLHAHNSAALIGEELVGAAVVDNLAAGLLIGVGQRYAELAAVAAGLAAAALHVVDPPGGQGAVDGLHVLNLHAPVHQPLDVLSRILTESPHQVLVHDAVPIEAHQVVVHHLRGVLIPLGLLPRGAGAQNLAAAAGC